ncbi:hypothetical protein NQ314_002261 [Rhamnusium bicolor]|uniref:Uncharacterized protein n=1 Tax=Rhamnusium bicolor TaxID=1586634 RepID=A0AAV8ZQ79_9CUCU|nr:hypothetical protein NQ314_002261 [Rhamnusium bicolor]
MSSLVNNNDELFQNSIKYLHSVSHLPALNVPVLKSFYSTKGRLMELRRGMYLPSNMTRTSVRCQRCLLNLLDGPASYRIKAEQKNNKFARKVLAKAQRNKPLTKYQREYLDRFSNFSGNQLAITCKFCKKESLIKLQKPERAIRSRVSTVLSQKKKKNKRKDKFSGLNQEAVLSLAPQNIRKLNNSCISLNSSDKKARFKLSKKENLEESKKVVVAKEKVIKSNNNKRKKNKSLNKLNEYLNKSNTSKINNSSSNLKQFLLGLES